MKALLRFGWLKRVWWFGVGEEEDGIKRYMYREIERTRNWSDETSESTLFIRKDLMGI